MANTLGPNIFALKALRGLGKATDEVSRLSEQLASGLRINRVSDDAAGLAMATGLQSDARVYGQAVRNLNDGISLLNTASGALDSIQSITARMQELAQQAANGTYSSSQRQALDTEAQSLLGEVNRIISSTTFNGISLLNGANSITLQDGRGVNATLNLQLQGISTSFGTVQTSGGGAGTFSSTNSFNSSGILFNGGVVLGDFNGDGKLDLIQGGNENGLGTTFFMMLGNGDGTFAAGTSFSSGVTGIKDIQSADVNGDGKLDLVYLSQNGANYGVALGTGAGTFSSVTAYASTYADNDMKLVDVNGDGKLDLIGATNNGAISVAFGTGSGTFGVATSYAATGTVGTSAFLTVGDFNGDGKSDVAVTDYNLNKVTIMTNNGSGSFTSGVSFTSSDIARVSAGDFNNDGKTDLVVASHTNQVSVLLGNGDSTFQTPVAVSTGLTDSGAANATLAVTDFDGDGKSDIVLTNYGGNSYSIMLSNGDGTFRVTQTGAFTFVSNIAIGDTNGDGAQDLVFDSRNFGSPAALSLVQDTNTSSSTTLSLSLLTQASAQTSIGLLSTFANTVAQEQGRVGAYISRVSFAVSNATTRRDLYSEAASRITDVDIADSVAKLISAQVRQQAATALLAQANLNAELVLKLLG